MSAQNNFQEKHRCSILLCIERADIGSNTYNEWWEYNAPYVYLGLATVQQAALFLEVPFLGAPLLGPLAMCTIEMLALKNVPIWDLGGFFSI